MIEPYANLRVAFSQDSEGAGDVYRIVASLDDGPQTESTFTLPMSAESIRREVRSIAVTRSAAATRVARVVDDEPAGDGSALGERLASALFTPDIETLVDQAREQGRFRLALNFTSDFVSCSFQKSGKAVDKSSRANKLYDPMFFKLRLHFSVIDRNP